jgi:hypothetical protein
MFFVHEIHALDPAATEAFETSLRDGWVPALASDESTRLVWSARSMPPAISYPEIVTLTAVTDGAALERLGERARRGDLRDRSVELGRHRRTHTVRVMAGLEEFNPYTVDLDELPLVRTDAPTEMYIHDFVVPRLGMQRVYEVQMRESFIKMLEFEALPMMIWAGLETVAGGGRTPESLMVTHINHGRAIAELLAHGNPRVPAEPGTWMADALKLRDTWISRLVRSLPWSPTS